MDAVDVEELPQSVEVYFLPKANLAVGQRSALYCHLGRAEAFPITDEFNHADVEHQYVEDVLGLVEVEERPVGDECRGGEQDVVADTEGKNDVQPVGLHIVMVTIVDKLGVSPAERFVFCLAEHLVQKNTSVACE